MKTLTMTGLLLVLTRICIGQINMEDSTVQVIGYWDNKEKQTYSVSLEKYKVKDNDTTSRELMTYEVDITIRDSSANLYTIEWFYKNFQLSSDDTIMKKIASASRDMSVIITTDEMGSFIEVVNWKEVRDYMDKMISALKKEFKDIPTVNEILKQTLGKFSSKEAIQASAIKDIRQFYTYHGAKYKLGKELSGKLKVSNALGGEPFDAEVTVLLDEINAEDDNVIIRMWQTVDSKQLTDISYEYVKNMSKKLGTKPPRREDIPPLVNETRTASRIHGPSGWVIYSVETKEIFADNISSFEERIIEIK